jgi:hypothetical protein
MATTMKLIAKVSLGSDASSIEFTSIPATYTDLLVLGSLRLGRSATSSTVYMQVNGDTGTTKYSSRRLYGNTDTGTGSDSFSGANKSLLVGDVTASTATSNTFGSLEVYIPNYAGSTNKSASFTGTQETNASTAYITIAASLWSDTSAITSIKIVSRVASNIRSGSSFFLYGISKA